MDREGLSRVRDCARFYVSLAYTRVVGVTTAYRPTASNPYLCGSLQTTAAASTRGT